MSVVVGPPMMPGTPASEQADADIAAAVAKQLAEVRSAADGWQKGLAGLLTLLTAVLFIKGKATIDKLDFPWQLAAAALLVAAAAAAVLSTFLILRAAYGQPEESDLQTLRAEGLYTWQFRKAKEAAANLKAGQLVLLAMLALVTATVLVTWFAPGAGGPDFKVVQSSPAACGQLQKADNGQYKITQDAQAAVIVSKDQLSTLHVADKCP